MTNQRVRRGWRVRRTLVGLVTTALLVGGAASAHAGGDSPVAASASVAVQPAPAPAPAMELPTLPPNSAVSDAPSASVARGATFTPLPIPSPEPESWWGSVLDRLVASPLTPVIGGGALIAGLLLLVAPPVGRRSRR